jgi:hypothetical protein
MRRAAHAPFLSHRKEFIAVLEPFLRAGEADVHATTVGTAARATGVTTSSGSAVPNPTTGLTAAGATAPTGPNGRSATPKAARAATSAPGKVGAEGTPRGGEMRPAKKKRMKARARKKLQASSR